VNRDSLPRDAKRDRIQAAVDAHLIVWKEREFGASGYALTDAGKERALETFESLAGCDVPWAGRDLRGGDTTP
jgi:hypothetical protein